MTYPALYGTEKSMKMAEELIDKAIGALEPFGEKAEPLRGIARYIITRDN
jgi:geranylgeranyl diphosphate synthase type II